MKEADITKAIRDLLNAFGVFHFKHWGGPMSPPGVSDIIGCYQGQFFAIEVKREGGKLTDAQERFLENVREAGGIGFVTWNVEDVIKELRLK